MPGEALTLVPSFLLEGPASLVRRAVPDLEKGRDMRCAAAFCSSLASGYDQAASSAIGLTTAEAANQPMPEHKKPMKKGGIPAATDPSCGPHREVGP